MAVPPDPLVPGGAGFAFVAIFCSSPSGEACSICRCGDPTFNALGKEGYTPRGFRFALDWERFDKDEGDPAEESESQVENRFTGLIAYGFAERFTLFARVPYSVRDLEPIEAGEPGETVHTNGLSDPELYGQVRLWASPLSSGVGRRTSLSLVAGVKTPWGQNDVQQDGERVDEHAQPGTGSTDVFGSLALLHLIDERSALFVSGGYRHTGENDFEYRYGSSFTANVAYERKLSRVFDSVLELNFRTRRRIVPCPTITRTARPKRTITRRWRTRTQGVVALRDAATIGRPGRGLRDTRLGPDPGGPRPQRLPEGTGSRERGRHLPVLRRVHRTHPGSEWRGSA